MKKSYKIAATIGFVSKGIIYLVIGILSLLAALNMGGGSSGTNQALVFLKKQPFGQILLMLLGVGLLCYSFWMFVQSIKDPEDLGNSRKAKLRRFGLFTTGLVYTFIAVLTFYHVFTYVAEGTSSSRYLNFIGPSTLSIVFICVGIVLAIQSIILILGVLKGGLLDQFNLEGHKYHQLIRRIGQFGFYSRAFIVAIIAYFFLRAGIYSGNHDIKGIQDAFSFLDQSMLGRILMGFTAVGFISYGAFYVLLTRYRSFDGE
ncbi:DUF1206 domain-containing protein [Aequorivita antarctica]|uniref:DUF1206 domain-containing protein n=1 Tax=Aequorivita antarctica TaxID=153266 RepID=A0A5C6Z049_9FLAO|nr:DUF1206 domain-containing protein [Aequorivita antarctica]TXD72867.1 DUF1206 domain-containing protein [Aequorivita antarctica]SRX76256.1 hypothetical protein AEQU3_03255 [Aequorivita antarctica]